MASLARAGKRRPLGRVAGAVGAISVAAMGFGMAGRHGAVLGSRWSSIGKVRHLLTCSRFAHQWHPITHVHSSFSTSSFKPSAFTFNSGPSMSLKAPQDAPLWNHTADDILALTKKAIASDQQALDAVGNLPHNECNFETVRSNGVAS